MKTAMQKLGENPYPDSDVIKHHLIPPHTLVPPNQKDDDGVPKPKKTKAPNKKFRVKACGTKLCKLYKVLAPKLLDTIAEMALLVWAKIHIIKVKKLAPIPTAPSSNVPSCPTKAVSTNDITGSAIPAAIAGKAIE